MFQKKIIIGSRGSELALWQANFVFNSLQKLNCEAEIIIIETKGDRIQDVALNQISGIGFFTKEIEDALLNKEIDIAVHSNKDLPTISPEGLKIAAVSDREDPSELLIINKEAVDEQLVLALKKNARVGTSSPRRKCQILSFRNDLLIGDLRGNIPTRINKLRDKKYDAIMLAAAGVYRLQFSLEDFHVEKLPPEVFIPAPAQGVLALQIRENDIELTNLLARLNVKDVEASIKFERTVLNKFEGGCHLALGAFTKAKENYFCTWITKSDSPDKPPARIYLEGTDADAIAKIAVEKLTDIKPCSVFVSRELNEKSYFYKVLNEYHFTVNGKSLINTETIKVNEIPAADWVFFSSSKAVEHFFEQGLPLNENMKYGAIGGSTAEAIYKFNKRPSFVGTNPEMKDVGKEFLTLVKNQRIIFPKSKQSLRTVQKELLDENIVLDLNVYETLFLDDFEERKEDVLVFTSPSNAKSYLNKFKIKDNQKVIAIGTSTKEQLIQLGIAEVRTASIPNEIGLAEAVFSL